MKHLEDFSGVPGAVDLLSDAPPSHLAYEEHELVERLARRGSRRASSDRPSTSVLVSLGRMHDSS
jgi:hypothetical protein